MNEIYQKVTMVLRDVMDNDEIVAAAELSAKDVKGWDSLSHIRLFIQLEKEFKIRFTTAEIAKLKNVGELVQAIQTKTGIGERTIS